MELLSRYPDKTLLCMTVIMPGTIKRNTDSLTVAASAMKALRELAPRVKIVQELDLETGYEAYALTDIDELSAKEMACDIEENTPLGRLFDIDIIDKQGVPISRESIGRPPRRCIVCENEARYCMRNHSHTQQEIQERIKQLIATA